MAVDRYGDFYFGDVNNFVVREVDTSHAKENIKMINSNIGISVYPNPVSNVMIISSPIPVTSVVISNVIGEITCTIPENTFGRQLRLNVKDYSPGIYLIRINGTGVAKFVKQ